VGRWRTFLALGLVAATYVIQGYADGDSSTGSPWVLPLTLVVAGAIGYLFVKWNRARERRGSESILDRSPGPKPKRTNRRTVPNHIRRTTLIRR
jgi:hypothetical protein